MNTLCLLKRRNRTFSRMLPLGQYPYCCTLLPFLPILNTYFSKHLFSVFKSAQPFDRTNARLCPAAEWDCPEEAMAQSLLFLTAPLKAWNVSEGLAEPCNKGCRKWLYWVWKTLSRFNTWATKILENRGQEMELQARPKCSTELHCS